MKRILLALLVVLPLVMMACTAANPTAPGIIQMRGCGGHDSDPNCPTG